MNREEELTLKAALALADPFLVELIRRAMAANPENFVGKVKRLCEILELENQLAASVRHAAILARDFPERFFRELTRNEARMKTMRFQYGGKQYQVNGDIYCIPEIVLIVLSEKEAIEIMEWSTSDPPQPRLCPIGVDPAQNAEALAQALRIRYPPPGYKVLVAEQV